MKEAIKYLKDIGIRCDKEGNILSKLPDGERGLTLVNMLEDQTGYTIIENKIHELES